MGWRFKKPAQVLDKLCLLKIESKKPMCSEPTEDVHSCPWRNRPTAQQHFGHWLCSLTPKMVERKIGAVERLLKRSNLKPRGCNRTSPQERETITKPRGQWSQCVGNHWLSTSSLTIYPYTLSFRSSLSRGIKFEASSPLLKTNFDLSPWRRQQARSKGEKSCEIRRRFKRNMIVCETRKEVASFPCQ